MSTYLRGGLRAATGRPYPIHTRAVFVGAACGRPPHRHGTALRSRHSKAKGRRIRLSRPYTLQNSRGTRDADSSPSAQNDRGETWSLPRSPPQSGSAGQLPRPGGAIRAGARIRGPRESAQRFSGERRGKGMKGGMSIRAFRMESTLLQCRRAPHAHIQDMQKRSAGGRTAFSFLYLSSLK